MVKQTIIMLASMAGAALVGAIFWGIFRSYKYIGVGEKILLSGNGYPAPFYSKVVEVDGWAAKLQGGGAIRKDLIKRNAKGEWFYVY